MKIVISIINSDPPSLKDKSKFSKEFKHFISMCLQKGKLNNLEPNMTHSNLDPEKRATTSDLLKHKFLLKAEDNEYLYDEFLAGKHSFIS